jgi:hypothetical protein
MDPEGGRARRVRTPVQRMRSSMLATSDLAKARRRDEEAATRSQNPTPNGSITTVRGWAKGEVVWAVRSFEFPARMSAGPWPARVAAATPAGSEFVSVNWLGGDNSAQVDAAGVQEFLHCAEHVAHAKRSRAAAFQAAVTEAVSVAEGGEATAKRQLAVEMKVEDMQSCEGAEGAAQKRQRRNRAAGAAGGTPAKEKVKEEEPPVAAEEELEVEEMSAYEKLRQANMNRNKQILDALELPNLPSFVHGEAAMVTVKARGLKGTRKAPEELPTRERSLRVQGKGPDGSQLELPSDWRELRFNPSSRKENGGAGRSSMSFNDQDDRRLRRTGDLTVGDTVPKDMWAEDPEVALSASQAQAESLMRKLSDAAHSTRGAAKSSSCVPAGRGGWRDCKSAADSLRAVAELQVAEADVAKVCPQRIASIAFHPMENHVVVAAGDKCGNIGVFTPDWASDDSCVTVFDVHTSSVTWMAFDDTSNPHALYSSSYENIVRRLDVQQQVFSEVLQLEEDQYDFLSTCHLEAGGRVLRCGFGSGHMHVVDLRGGKPTTVHLHNKTIRSIDLSPGNSNLLLTGSIDHSARIWDIRKLRRSESLADVTHSQVCSI